MALTKAKAQRGKVYYDIVLTTEVSTRGSYFGPARGARAPGWGKAGPHYDHLTPPGFSLF